MVVFPHEVRPISSGMHLSIVMKAVLVLTTFSRTSMTARQFVLPVRAGYRHVPVRCQSQFALPQLRRAGCLFRNMRRWTQTATSPPHYGKFQASCNHCRNCVTRKGTGHGQCHWPVGSRDLWAVAAGLRHTCAVRADGRLVCLGCNEYGQCDVDNR